MLEGVRTCPRCHERVLPTADDQCPSCRAYRFVGAAVETPSASLVAERQQANQQNLAHGAALYWRAFGWLVLALPLAIATVVVHFLVRAGGDPAGPDLHPMKLALLVADGVVLFFLLPAAAALRRWLGDADPRTEGHHPLNLLLLLKHARLYFEDQKVPMGAFGPRLPKEPKDDEA